MTNALSKIVRSHIPNDGIFLERGNYRNCWSDAFYNLLTSPNHLPAMKHRLTAGSLITTTGHGLWGKRALTVPDHFYKNYMDAHCWIEDCDGRVWDFIHPLVEVPHLKIPEEGISIDGMTKRDIRRKYGLNYISAPHYTILHIFNKVFDRSLPLQPRWDDSGMVETNAYVRFTTSMLEDNKSYLMTENNLGAFTQWRNDMDFLRLVDGDMETQKKWRRFLSKPLDRKRFTPMVAQQYGSGFVMWGFDNSTDTDNYLKYGMRTEAFREFIKDANESV
jgi:hypothetical protein